MIGWIVCTVLGHRFALWEKRSPLVGLLSRYFKCDRCGLEVYRKVGAK